MASSKLLIEIDVAIENRAKELISEVLSKHILAADKELQDRFGMLSDRLAREVSTAAKSEFKKHFQTVKPKRSK